ncbi:MAG TPA: HlyD family efflux transporter periplasmic adaptor subunit [bacterium]|nr:HlyD family efflux transporter periplasmic adaptor subunit [bacterium]
MKLKISLKRIPFKDRRFWGLSALAAVILIMVFMLVMRVSAKDDSLWVQVQKGDFIIDLIESGEIRSVNSVFVKAPMEWRMELQIIDMVPEGTMVEEGDFLIQLDTGVLEEELDKEFDKLKQTEAELRSVETKHASRIKELETNLKIAILSKEAAHIKVDQLKYESNTRQEEARLELQKELIRFDETEKKIETQRIIDIAERQKVALSVEQARNSVESINKRINEFTLLAPISGMVVYQEIGGWDSPRYKSSIGDKVRPGQAIISIPNLSSMKMVAQVNEIDAMNLNVGKKVFIRLDAFEETIYNGKVMKVSPLIEKMNNYWNPFSKPPSFEVNILIDEKSDILKPGMTAQGRIILEEIPEVLFVPVGAVFELNDGTSVVYTKRSFPDPVLVKLGKRNDRFVIVEEGLSEEDNVTLSQPSYESHPLGWIAEMERRKTEFKEFLNHIDTMNELGLTYEPAEKDTTQNKISTQQKTQSSMVTEKNIVIQNKQ